MMNKAGQTCPSPSTSTSMTTLQAKQLFGYTLNKRTKIAPSRPLTSVQSSTTGTAQVTTAAKKVIKEHRKVLIALRDR